MNGICYQNMSTVQISHGQVYNLITTKRTNCYCKKSCESMINMNFNIFCKHMAILSVPRLQHHTKVVEPYFSFLHLHLKL